METYKIIHSGGNIHSFIHLFIYSFIHLFIYSFIHLFIYSFIHSLVHFNHLIIFSFFHLYLLTNAPSYLTRSICWRVLLNVLPCSSIDWIPALESLRSTYFSLQVRDRTAILSINFCFPKRWRCC